jgi:hypothetical protein
VSVTRPAIPISPFLPKRISPLYLLKLADKPIIWLGHFLDSNGAQSWQSIEHDELECTTARAPTP